MTREETMQLIEFSPSLPQLSSEIRDVLHILDRHEELDLTELSRLLSRCDDLEINILQFINRGYFKLTHRVCSIKEAITLLGIETIRFLLIAYITNALLPINSGNSKIFSSKKYWNHILATAVACEMICEKIRIQEQDKYKLFSYGLIHDIGITVLDACLPEIMDQVVQIQSTRMVHQIIVERELMGGITHADIGAWLCQNWGFPVELQNVVKFHHHPALSKIETLELKILHVGDLISSNHYQRLLGFNLTHLYPQEILKSIGMTEADIEDIRIHLEPRIEIAKDKIWFEQFHKHT